MTPAEPSLEELLKRVEAATGADRELDRAIWKACGIDYRKEITQPVTSSLDAALDLVERVLPGWKKAFGEEWEPNPQYPYPRTDGKNPTTWTVVITPPMPSPQVYAGPSPTPALALLAALLKAVQAKGGDRAE